MKAIIFILKAAIIAAILLAATGTAICSTTLSGFFSSFLLGGVAVAIILDTKFQKQD